MLAGTLNFLRSNPMTDTVFREITGNNIPHVLIVRNKDELVDQSISQFGNTAAYFGAGALLDKLLNIIPRFVRRSTATPASRAWFYLGKSLSIFSMIASINLAMPFLRNYITIKRTGTSGYAEMIGEKHRAQKSQTEVRQEARSNLQQFWRTVGIGAAGASGLILSSLWFIRTGRGFPRWLQQFPASVEGLARFFKAGKGLATTFGLKEGKFKNFTPPAAIAFWVIPTFAGLLAAARDKYEVKELALRFAAFNLAFFVFPFTVENLIERMVKNLPQTRLLGPSQNIAYLGKLVSSMGFCSAVPTLLNIYLTRQRVKRDEEKRLSAQSNPLFGSALQRKPGFYQYIHTETAALPRH